MTRFLIAAALLALAPQAGAQPAAISIRTETYPRPPSSGATYYIYEQGGRTTCTKLAVCNKFGECRNTYRKGPYKAQDDARTGDPYGTTAAVPIPAAKLRSHVCLTKFGLI